MKRLRHVWIPIWLSCCAALGCSGSTSIDGTFEGRSFTIADGISGLSNGDGIIIITNFAPACDAVSTLQLGSNAQVLEFALGSGGSFATGTYGVAPGSPMIAQAAVYEGYSGSCTAKTYLSATNGSIVLDSVQSLAVTGSFDLSMNSGDHVSGSFQTTHCAAIESPAFANSELACR